MLLKDKVAIITGAAQGIGAAFAHGYAKEGAKIVIADISDGKEAVKAVEEAGGEAIYVKTDVTSQDSCKTMAQATVDRFDKIDIVLNNAAMYANITKKPFTEISTGEWNHSASWHARCFPSIRTIWFSALKTALFSIKTRSDTFFMTFSSMGSPSRARE